MAQNLPSPQQKQAASTPSRQPAEQGPPSPAPAQTPSVSRRPPPEETQQNDADGYESARVSHVRILPTSLPYVHDQLMEHRDREQRARSKILEERLQEAHDDDGQGLRELSPEEQATTARALKPHARSVVDLDKLHLEPPISRPTTQQPKRSRKWQFGIRSRNQPYEAMLYLYRAIAAQGGVWDIQPVESGKLVCCVSPDFHSPPEGTQIEPDSTSSDHPKPLQNKYPDLPSDYYIPRDPWFIRARLLKEGITAPGPSTSVHNSRSDFEDLRRRFNISSISAPVEDNTNTSPPADSGPMSGPSSATQPNLPRISHGVWVFIDIQLYQLEENNYMVDFKCDGYQNVIRAEGDAEWHPISKRLKNKEKEITSPYPFLDVASDLVAQLAVAS